MKRIASRLLAVLVLIVFLGCGADMPATVQGTVTVDGNAVTGKVAGEVMFHPNGGGAMAMSSIKPDGSFTISTGATKGLEPGDYRVTVRLVEVEPEPAGGYQSAPQQTPLAPSRYGDRDKSELTAAVQPGENDFTFDLKSK